MDNERPQAGPTMLVVEDDEDSSFLFCSELRKMAPHWRIACRRDGRGAIRQLQDAPAPQGIVTGLRLTDMGGLELIVWVKAQPQFRLLPLVVFSSSNDALDRERCLSLEVSDFLEKRGAIKELRRTIRSILRLCEESVFYAQDWERTPPENALPAVPCWA